MPSFAGKIKIGDNRYPIAATLYGVCNTEASEQTKQVTLAGFDTLVEGVLLAVYFDKTNTAANPKLKVNTTDAKPIYLDNNNTPGTTALKSWAAKEVCMFVYDGSYWMMCADRKAVHDAITNHETRITSAETKIGTTALPTTAQTLTGAVAEHETDITGVNTKIGTTALPTTAQTLTGAIAEHETDISGINTTISGMPGTASPKMDGTATVGTATKYARQDHIHPIDTSRAAASSLTTTNNNVTALTTRVSTAESNISTLSSGKEPKKLIFTSKAASSWTANGSTTFPKRCAIACSGVTDAMTAYVCFSAAQAESGNYSPYAECYAGGVYIYSTLTTSITVPKIIVFAGA